VAASRWNPRAAQEDAQRRVGSQGRGHGCSRRSARSAMKASRASRDGTLSQGPLACHSAARQVRVIGRGRPPYHEALAPQGIQKRSGGVNWNTGRPSRSIAVRANVRASGARSRQERRDGNEVRRDQRFRDRLVSATKRTAPLSTSAPASEAKAKRFRPVIEKWLMPNGSHAGNHTIERVQTKRRTCR